MDRCKTLAATLSVRPSFHCNDIAPLFKLNCPYAQQRIDRCVRGSLPYPVWQPLSLLPPSCSMAGVRLKVLFGSCCRHLCVAAKQVTLLGNCAVDPFLRKQVTYDSCCRHLCVAAKQVRLLGTVLCAVGPFLRMQVTWGSCCRHLCVAAKQVRLLSNCGSFFEEASYLGQLLQAPLCSSNGGEIARQLCCGSF